MLVYGMEGIPASSLWDTVIDMLHPQVGGDFKHTHQTQKYYNIMNHVETLIVCFRTRDYSACELHVKFSKTTML